MTALPEGGFAYPTSDDFAATLGPGYRLTSGDLGWDADLVTCDVAGRTETTEQFTLLFRAASLPIAEQGLYHVVHDGLGEFEVFLVPVARDDDHVQLEAVFNLMANPPEA